MNYFTRYISRAPLLFWYCFDDHLATFFKMDEIGHLPTIVWFFLLVVVIGLDGAMLGVEKLISRFKQPTTVQKMKLSPAVPVAPVVERPEPLQSPKIVSVPDPELKHIAIAALTSLRVAEPVAKRAVERALINCGSTASVEQLTKEALKQLA